MKKIFLAFSLLISIIAIGLFLFFLNMNQNTDDSSTISAFDLPRNAVHISSQILNEEAILRVEIIANIAQGASGFDLSLAYDTSNLTPLNENTPAQVGSLFVNASPVRNQVNNENDSVRVIYVHFGEQNVSTGAGSLATIDFMINSGAENTQVVLEDARLSRINQEGIAEYIDMNIGDPRIFLVQDTTGNLQIISGLVPESNFNVLLLLGIGTTSFAVLGLIILLFTWLFKKSNRNISSARA